MRIAPRRRPAALQARCTACCCLHWTALPANLHCRSDCTAQATLMLHWDALKRTVSPCFSKRRALVCRFTSLSTAWLGICLACRQKRPPANYGRGQ